MNPYAVCCFGEILWDLLPTGQLPGGAPMNVAIHLQKLGVHSALISCVGQDELGVAIHDFIASANCSTQFIQTTSAFPTGTVHVSLSEQRDATYDIVYPVAWDQITLSNELIDLVAGAQAFVFGTLAARHTKSRTTLLRLLEVARLKVYDINLRSPYYTQETVECFLQRADMVKMNDDELAILAAWYQPNHTTIQEKMQHLVQQFPLKTLIVTQGGDGATVLHEGKFYTSEGFNVTVADTIGSGDSFLAGFLKNYLTGQPIQHALNYACALGALVASHQGANPPITEEQIQAMLNQKSGYHETGLQS